MDFFHNSNWRLPRLLLRSFGAWPFQSPHAQIIIRSVVIILIASIFIPEILKLTVVWGDLNLMVECAPILALHSLTISKLSNCLWNTNKIKVLLMQIQKDWQSDLSYTEKQILKHYGRQNRRITHTYIYFIYVVTVMYLATPLVPKALDYFVPLNESRTRIFPYQAEYFVDNVKYEVPILMHAIIISPFPSTVIVAFDSVYANCVQHACSMFIIVGRRLRNVSRNGYSTKSKCDVVAERNIYQYLSKCIKKHEDILQFSQRLESNYSNTLIVIVGINMIAISITGLQTLIKINDLSEVVRFGIYTIGQVIHLFFLSWPGQKLMDHSGQICQSVYQGKWYNFPLKTKQLLILVIMRSRKPCRITAGKMYTMSAKSFANVVQKSVSYFTVFSSMK